MDEIVTLTHRNVCKDGFTVIDTVDSVFLDLPAPWDAIEHAKKALRKDRPTRICCFSPCMEQVLRTVTALNDAGFTDITMYETLMRPHQVDVVPPLPTVTSIGSQLKEMEARREAKRLRQIANSRSRVGDKRKREDTEGAEDSEGQQTRHADEAADGPGKRVKTEQEASTADASEPAAQAAASLGSGLAPAPENVVEAPQTELPVSKISVSKAFPEVRGHTSYLTFAVLLPAVAIAEATANIEPVTTEATPEATPVEGS
ncbi:hypothetical protein QCA50_006776 [Cerrena zonata]|uniref:tRNA (adenine(58)-N(1))-methyltransferase catalytic subunit TRM61 n=1 Tax=Cerrena zonata TaxID=2478898 RepID=A0AAW0GCH6_9APHY